MIDPDGEGGEAPFTVQCRNSSNIFLTSVSHDRETPTYIANAFEPAYSNNVDVTYSVSYSQLMALTTMSLSCEVNVYIRCRDTWITNHAGWYGTSGGLQMLSHDLCQIPGRLTFSYFLLYFTFYIKQSALTNSL